MKASAVLYVAREPRGDLHQLVTLDDGTKLFIRGDVLEGMDVGEALDAASPFVGEAVLNSIPLYGPICPQRDEQEGITDLTERIIHQVFGTIDQFRFENADERSEFRRYLTDRLYNVIEEETVHEEKDEQ